MPLNLQYQNLESCLETIKLFQFKDDKSDLTLKQFMNIYLLLQIELKMQFLYLLILLRKIINY